MDMIIVAAIGASMAFDLGRLSNRAREEPFVCVKCGQRDYQRNECIACEQRRKAEKQRHERELKHQKKEHKAALQREKEREEHELRLKKMMDAAKKEEQKVALQREKERQEYELRLKKMADSAEQAKRTTELKAQLQKQKQDHAQEVLLKEKEAKEAEKIRVEQTQRINKSIQTCDNDINRIENEMKENEKKLHELQQILVSSEARLEEKEENLKQFNASLEDKISSQSRELKVDEYHAKVAACEEQIQGAINSTCVSESNLVTFLTFVQCLTGATRKNQESIDRLSVAIGGFGDLITREVNDKLSIEYYFATQGLDCLIPILHDEGMDDMEDIICDGEAKNDEYTELLDIIKNGLEEQHSQWEKMTDDEKQASNQTNAPPKELDKKKARKFKNACLKPHVWQKRAKEKQDGFKEVLNVTSPIYSLFFQRIFASMQTVQALLSYTDYNALTDNQQKAIQAAETKDENNNNNNNDNDEKKELEVVNKNKDNNKNKKTQISKLIVALDDNVRKSLKNGLALQQAAVHSIDVVESMQENFDSCQLKGGTAKTIASGIENACMAVVESFGNIQIALLLAQEVYKLKPASLTNPKAKQLWEVVDGSIVQIFDTALKLNKNSAIYFNFFLLFRHAFEYYISRQDKSLFVSTEHIQRDIKDFVKFSLQFQKQVSQLSENAMSCIKNCVEKSSGAKAFETAQSEKKEYERKYLDAKKEYNKFVNGLDIKRNELFVEKLQFEEMVQKGQLAVKSVQSKIESQKQIRQCIQETKNELLLTKSNIK